MTYLYKNAGFVDIRILSLIIGEEPVCLHLIVRNKMSTMESGILGRSVPVPDLYFLLREFDNKVLRNINNMNQHDLFKTKNENTIRQIINTTCRDSYTLLTPPELKALKHLGVLSSRTPKASLINPHTAIKLLHHFDNDLNATTIASIIVSILSEQRILSDFMLNLKPAVLEANARFGYDNSLQTSFNLLKIAMGSTYPPPYSIFFPPNHPILDTRASSILAQFLHHPKKESTTSILKTMNQAFIGYTEANSATQNQLNSYSHRQFTNLHHTNCNDQSSIGLPGTESRDNISYDDDTDDDDLYFFDLNEWYATYDDTVESPQPTFNQSFNSALAAAGIYQANSTIMQPVHIIPTTMTPDSNNLKPLQSPNDEKIAELVDVFKKMSLKSVVIRKESRTDILVSYNLANSALFTAKPLNNDALSEMNTNDHIITVGEEKIQLSQFNSDTCSIPRVITHVTLQSNGHIPDDCDIDHVVKTFQQFPQSPLNRLKHEFFHSDGRKNPDSYAITEDFEEISRNHSGEFSSFGMISSEDVGNTMMLGGIDDRCHDFYLKVQHRTSLSAIPIILSPRVSLQFRPHFIFNYPDIFVRPQNGSQSSDDYHAMILSHENLQKVKKVPKAVSKNFKSQDHIAYLIAKNYHSYILNFRFLPSFYISSPLQRMSDTCGDNIGFEDLIKTPNLCLECVKQAFVYSKYFIPPDANDLTGWILSHTPQCHTLSHIDSQMMISHPHLLSFSGIVNFQFLFALNLFNLHRRFPYEVFGHHFSYEQYYTVLIMQSMKQLLGALKTPVVYLVTQVEFSQEELELFFKDTDYLDDGQTLPDAIVIEDTIFDKPGQHETSVEDMNQYKSIIAGMFDDTGAPAVRTTLNDFEDKQSAVSRFPYVITRESLPFFRSLLYQIESMVDTYKLRLWRQIGCYFTPQKKCESDEAQNNYTHSTQEVNKNHSEHETNDSIISSNTSTCNEDDENQNELLISHPKRQRHNAMKLDFEGNDVIHLPHYEQPVPRKGRGRKSLQYHLENTHPSNYPDWVREKLDNTDSHTQFPLPYFNTCITKAGEDAIKQLHKHSLNEEKSPNMGAVPESTGVPLMMQNDTSHHQSFAFSSMYLPQSPPQTNLSVFPKTNGIPPSLTSSEHLFAPPQNSLQPPLSPQTYPNFSGLSIFSHLTTSSIQDFSPFRSSSAESHFPPTYQQPIDDRHFSDQSTLNPQISNTGTSTIQQSPLMRPYQNQSPVLLHTSLATGGYFASGSQRSPPCFNSNLL